jgi:hypothetical protein
MFIEKKVPDDYQQYDVLDATTEPVRDATEDQE